VVGVVGTISAIGHCTIKRYGNQSRAVKYSGVGVSDWKILNAYRSINKHRYCGLVRKPSFRLAGIVGTSVRAIARPISFL